MIFKPTHADLAAPDQKRPTNLGPASEGPIVKKKKLLIIDGDLTMVQVGRRLFGSICEIPEDIQNVTSLVAAKELVDKHRPDIVLSGKRINGFGPDAYYDLLDYIKGQYPGTRVVLWSGGVCGDERREGTAHQYDAVVLRTDFDGIRDAVTRFSE